MRINKPGRYALWVNGRKTGLPTVIIVELRDGVLWWRSMRGFRSYRVDNIEADYEVAEYMDEKGETLAFDSASQARGHKLASPKYIRGMGSVSGGASLCRRGTR